MKWFSSVGLERRSGKAEVLSSNLRTTTKIKNASLASLANAADL